MQTVSRVTVSDVMTHGVITIPQSDSLQRARDLMASKQVSQLVAVDHRKRPVGLISKLDMARFLLEDSTSRSLDEISVSEASSKSIPFIRQELSVFNAARMFDTENLACAIVMDDEPLIGIVTETDLSDHFARNWSGRFKVLNFMMRDFIFAKSNYPVLHVAYGIVFRQPTMPVIDDGLVGIMTLSDLLSIKDDLPKNSLGRLNAKPNCESALMTTKDLMTINPITTHVNTDLAQAAHILITNGIGSLPVLDDRSEKVAGLLTKHHIVEALGRVNETTPET